MEALKCYSVILHKNQINNPKNVVRVVGNIHKRAEGFMAVQKIKNTVYF